MKAVAILLALAAIAVGVWLALPGGSGDLGSDPKSPHSAPKRDEPEVPLVLPSRLDVGEGVPPPKPPGPNKPLTVDEFIDRHMGKHRAAKTLTPMQQLEAAEVTLSCENWNGLDAILEIAGEAGVPIVASEEVQAELKASTLNLEFEDTPGKNAIDMVLPICGQGLTLTEKEDRVLIHRK